jgi:S-DNA-T family DNA segregation ATPase FtsK/SpoIIIE
MRKMLEYQADRIEGVLVQHKVPGRVTGGTVTPRWIRFKVLPALGARVSRIKGLSEDLAVALDASSCRVARQGAAVMVEIPRDDPRPVHLRSLLDQLRDVPPVTAVLGIADDGAPLLIRLPSPDVAHILVAGTTGSGKTALLRTIVLSLAVRHPGRGELQLVLLDPKGRAFGDLAGLPQLGRLVARAEEATEALGSLVRLMERRDARREDRPSVVVVIDELADLMMTGGAEAERHLTRLVQRGREAGIHVVAATQKPSAAVIGSLVKANFPVRLVGKVASAQDASVASGWPGTGAERLLGKGDFVAVAEGRLHRFQAAYISKQEAAEIVAALQRDALPRLPAGAGGLALRAEDPAPVWEAG